MIKVAHVVEDILYTDEVAFEAARLGVLNLSAYSESILSRVEQRTMKSVKKNTIVVTLSRLAEQVSKKPSLRPKVQIEDLNIRSSLAVVTYEKTGEVRSKIKKLSQKFLENERQFFLLTQGVGQLTVILPAGEIEELQKEISQKPLVVSQNVVGITLRFSTRYTEVPNLFHAILAKIATQNISIIEILSTYTEFSLFIKKRDQQRLLQVLETFVT